MISVILTAHNSNKKYLEEGINSILNQTCQDFEVLIMDDASDSSCALFIDEIAEKDSRIIVCHQPKNAGVSVNRNQGIENAKGDYLTFIDDDDYIERDFLSKLYSSAVECNADIVTCNFLQKKGDVITENPYNAEAGKVYRTQSELEKVAATVIDPKTPGTNMSLLMLSSAWGKLYRRQFLIENPEVRYPEGMMGGEDAVFFLKALKTKKPPVLKTLSDSLYVYRKNEESYTVGFQSKLPEQNLERLRWFYRLSSGCDIMEKAAKRNACYAIVDMCSVYLADEKCPIKNKKKYLRETLLQPEYRTALDDLSDLGYGFLKRTIYSFAKRGILSPVLLVGKIYRKSK